MFVTFVMEYIPESLANILKTLRKNKKQLSTI